MNHPEVEKIAALFGSSNNFDEAHQKSIAILENLVNDKSFIHSVIKYNLSDPAYLNRKRHYPTLALSIFKNNIIDMVVNIFPSLPDKSTDISFQSIHHHGNLKLSTIGLSGPGYSSLLFKRNYTIQPETNCTDLKLEALYQNEVGKYTYCDAYVPHVVFYPTQMSSTLVLWSKSKSSFLNNLKALFPRALSKSISVVLNGLGLRKALDLNMAEYHDFYPENGKFYALKERIGYPEGSNENFIQNIFYYMQSVGFKDFEFLQNLKNKAGNPASLAPWIDRFCAGEPIEDEFLPTHLNISPKVNNKLHEIQAAFE